MNLSIVNVFILEKLAKKKKQPQLDFHQELAKLLIAGYNRYKRPSNTGKRALQTVTIEENLEDISSANLSAGKRLVQCA